MNSLFAIIAHRGAGGLAPENTLAALRKAAELGVDYAEIDIRPTSDRRLVLMHDAEVDRTTDSSGTVSRFSLEQIKELKAGREFGRASDPVPELGAALRFAQSLGGLKLFLDVKEAWTVPSVVEEALRTGTQVALGVRNIDMLHECKSAPGVLAVAMIKSQDMVRAAVERGARAVRLWDQWAAADPELVRRVREAGAQAWIMLRAEHTGMLGKLVRLGVDGLIVDSVEQALRFRRDMQPGGN